MLWIASAQNGRAGSHAPSHVPTVEQLHASTRVSRLGGGSAQNQRTEDRLVRRCMGTLETNTGPAQRFKAVRSIVVGADGSIGVHVTRPLG